MYIIAYPFDTLFSSKDMSTYFPDKSWSKEYTASGIIVVKSVPIILASILFSPTINVKIPLSLTVATLTVVFSPTFKALRFSGSIDSSFVTFTSVLVSFEPLITGVFCCGLLILIYKNKPDAIIIKHIIPTTILVPYCSK